MAGHYAVIFSSRQNTLDEAGRAAYAETASRMLELAAMIPGYIGVESVHQNDGAGITISYWQSEDAIKHWRDNVEHAEARARGKAEWYANYSLKVAHIERACDWQTEI